VATDNTNNIDDPKANDPKVAPPVDDAKAPAKSAARKAPAKPAAAKTAAAKTDSADAKPAKTSAPKKPAKTASEPKKATSTSAAKTDAVAAEPKKATSARVAKPKTALADKAVTSEAEVKTAVRKPKTAVKAAKTVSLKPKAEVKTGEPGKATVVDQTGKQVGTIDLDPTKFAVPANINTLHLVVRASQAARRRGTASTKTRGEISGSTAKLYRQKSTGRARVGSVKSPTRIGGGVAFGPHPRSYDIKINRKVVRKALLMALSDRASNGSLFVARDLQLDKPSTARVNEFLVGLEVAAPVLVVTHDEPQVTLSTRNLVYAEVTEVTTLTTEQVLRARSLVLTEKAFTALSQA